MATSARLRLPAAAFGGEAVGIHFQQTQILGRPQQVPERVGLAVGQFGKTVEAIAPLLVSSHYRSRLGNRLLELGIA